MTERIVDYAVVYDLSSDRERARVSKILKGFGFRVQKSVFECRLDTKNKNELIRKLKELHLTSGFIKLYRLIYSNSHPVIGVQTPIQSDYSHAFIL